MQTSIKGKFNYMPPESFGEGPVGPAIDVWGLACVITEMHTLKAPWKGVQMQRIMRAVCSAPAGSGLGCLIPERTSGTNR